MRHAQAACSAIAWVLLGACSAVIDVDTDKLGGRDASASNGSSLNPDGSAPIDTCDDGCSDGIPCTADQCVGNLCVYTPNNGICKVGEVCDVTRGCVAAQCMGNGDCDDGVGCTVDLCDPATGCRHTPDPSLCDDGIACTDDACNGALATGDDGCLHTPNDNRCRFCFGDGRCEVDQGGCTGSQPRDCSDGNPCTSDLCDDARMRCLNDGRDEDGDGSPANIVGGTFCGGGDCDDSDPSRFPGAPELCDTKDNDCDNSADEGCTALPDRCDTAQTLRLDNQGRAAVTGALATFSSNYATSCTQTPGRDAVYAIPIRRTSDIVIDSGDSDADLVLAVSTTCQDSSFTSTCAGAIHNSTSRSRLMIHNYDPKARGDMVYLLVDGASQAEQGAFRVTIQVTEVTEDSCDAPFDLGACGTVFGFFDEGGIVGTERGSCQSAPGEAQPEAIFKLTAPSDGTLVATAQSAQFFPALSLRTLCSSSSKDSELACINSADGGSGPPQRRAEITVRTPTSGSLFLLLDGGQSGASYSLKCVP